MKAKYDQTYQQDLFQRKEMFVGYFAQGACVYLVVKLNYIPVVLLGLAHSL